MEDLDKQSDELERQRLELLKQTYKLLDDLRGDRVRQHSCSGFPFNLLEAAVSGALIALERAVSRTVDAALDALAWRQKR